MPAIEIPEHRVRTTGAATKHSKFYFDDGSVIIKVEDTLFNVHKYQLLESETFSDMFKVPKGASNNVEEGSSPEHPIVLDGVSSSDFEALLTVLYTRHFSSIHPQPEASLVVPAFRLAHMWNFADLRDHLLPLAEKVLGDVDKIILSRELGIQEWLVPAYVEICRRPETLSIEEATKLGVHSLLMISRMREQSPPGPKPSSRQAGGYYCHSCVGMTYMGSSRYDCRSCGSGSHILRDNRSAGHGATGHADVETQVKEWVESGCILTK